MQNDDAFVERINVKILSNSHTALLGKCLLPNWAGQLRVALVPWLFSKVEGQRSWDNPL